jgi:phage/plasmid-associated DNA primase
MASRNSPVGGGLSDQQVQALVLKFGSPFKIGMADRITGLNEDFWAAYYLEHQIEVIFSVRERQFFSYQDSTGLFGRELEPAIGRDLSMMLLEASRQWKGAGKLEDFRNTNATGPIINKIREQTHELDPFNGANPRIIHCANCVLEFNASGSYARKDFSADFRSRNASPILYAPGATCPKFKDKLLAPLDVDSRDLLQKYAGQILLGHNFSHRMLILDGESDAGKTTVILVIAGIVGERNITELRTHLLHERFELASAMGKTLLLGPDVKADFLSTPGASKLKAMVGGDLLNAECKGINERFQVRGHWNALLSSNSRLKIRLEGDQKAWRRRLAIIRYQLGRAGIRISDFHLVLLESEASGILNWMLEGASKLQADLTAAGDINIPKKHQDLVDSLLNESDSLRIFLQANIERPILSSPQSRPVRL